MRVIAAIAVLFTIAGCRSEANAKADGRILWDKQGCAYYVNPHFGDTSFIRPLPDSNAPECNE